MVHSLDSGHVIGSPVSLLAISGSPRRRGNSEILLERAIEGAQSLGALEVVRFHLSEKRLSACIHCNQCKKKGICIAKDSTNELVSSWFKADAVIYATPVYHMDISSPLKIAIDKLGHVLFGRYERTTPRFMKVIGAIAQGNSGFGGQELALARLIQHAVVMNCLPVSADKPESYLGVGGRVHNKEKGGIVSDQIAMDTAYQLGRRVYEAATIIKAGIESLWNSLPPEYRSCRKGDDANRETKNGDSIMVKEG